MASGVTRVRQVFRGTSEPPTFPYAPPRMSDGTGPHISLAPAIEDALVAALETADPAARTAAIDALCARHPDDSAAIRAHVARLSQPTGTDPAPANRLREALAAQVPTVDRYRVIERLGSGGHGDVWLAEQLTPVRRDVALKVLRAEAWSDEVVARFDAERQALALLDHPGIAQILDAGTTAEGRPFVAIALVPSARSLLEFCIEERVPLRDRLALFAKLCDAVQHAHARGILHRDLKPANVLCARRDGEAAPVVIDFGIAKATGGRLTDLALRTSPGTSLGTPRYASPEQARGSLDIDIRSDVHALGAILHELLCGEPPFEEVELGRLYAEDRAQYFDVIVNREPHAPSRRLAAREGSTDAFGEPLAVIRRQVLGDLDAITARAIARDRHRRYPTVSELAADVRRALDGEAVLARGGRWTYRLAVSIRRHRVAAAAIVLAVVGIAVGLVAVLAANAELQDALERERQTAQDLEVARADAEAERDRADRAAASERDRAEQLAAARNEALGLRDRAAESAAAERERAEELARTTARLSERVREMGELRRVLRNIAGSMMGEGEPTLGGFADRIAELLDAGEAVYLRGVEAELRQTAGWLLAGLERPQDAAGQFEAALEVHDGDDDDAMLARAEILHALGDETSGAVDVRTKMDALREAAEIYGEVLGENAPETLMTRGDLGFLQVQAGQALGALTVKDVTSRTLFGEPDDARLLALVGEVSRLLDAGDRAAAERRLDELIQPVLEQPLFRARLCNVLWAAAQQYEALAPLLLRAAVRYGEEFNGRGHTHVVVARVHLIQWLNEHVALDDDATLQDHAEWLAHAFEQRQLDAVLPRSPYGGVKVGELYFGLAKNFASRRGYLTDNRTELRTAVAGSGILGPADLKAFEAECGW